MHKLTSGDSQESFVEEEKALNYGEQLEKGELSSRNLSLLWRIHVLGTWVRESEERDISRINRSSSGDYND